MEDLLQIHDHSKNPPNDDVARNDDVSRNDDPKYEDGNDYDNDPYEYHGDFDHNRVYHDIQNCMYHQHG